MKIKYMKHNVKKHSNLKQEISIHFLYVYKIFAKFQIHFWQKHKNINKNYTKKGFILIKNFIIYSLRNIKATKTAILKA